MTNTAPPPSPSNPKPNPSSPPPSSKQEPTTATTTNTTNPNLEEWEINRNHHKSLADTAYRSSSYATAIHHYTLALSFDPDDTILYSNRSAAYLSNGEKSRALSDAKKCVELKPDWVKGHNRMAAAMVALGRWNEARRVYEKVVLGRLDKGNEVAARGLEECKRGEERVRLERARELERLEEEKRRREEEDGVRVRVDAETNGSADAMKTKDISNDQSVDKETDATTTTTTNEANEDNGNGDEEDDLLNDFFDDVEEATTASKPPPPPTQSTTETNDSDTDSHTENKIHTQLSDLVSTTTQINRLLCPNHEWYNLNPYRVLDVSHRAPPEIVSRRYKALGLLLHPDKVRNNSNNNGDSNTEDQVSQAAKAFEFVRKANETLQDDDKAKHIRSLIEQGHTIGRKDYESSHPHNKTPKTQLEKEELHNAQDKATLKIFAEIEHKRRDVERRKRTYEMRERAQEDAELKKEKDERTFEKKWKEEGRVEKRIGNWRDFKGGDGSWDGKKKKKKKTIA